MKTQGFTLIEIVVYIGILGIIAVFVATALIQISELYSRARAERETLANARLILETVANSTKESKEVYGPTSIWLSDAGQLSLVTPANPPLEHDTAYVDFYLDNGRLWRKKEGESASPLSAATVRVAKFRLTEIMQGINREAVAITLEVDSAANNRFPAAVTLNTTIPLRGNY